MKPTGRLGVVVSLVLGVLSCDAPTALVDGGAQLAWVSAPPATLREGDSATVIVELRDGSGQPLLALDGAPVSLRFTFAQDSQPGTACGAACTTTVAHGRAQITVAWVSAGSWTAVACVRPAAPADSACAHAPLTVLPVQAALVTFPSDSVGRRVRFPVEARLRLPDGTPVTDLARTVRLRFTSAAPAAGHVQCPEAGPVCQRAPVAGVVRLDSVVVLDTAATTLEACAVAPNGHERCDPAGPRTFRVVVPRVTLHFVTGPSGGPAGVSFATQPVIEALEPDGTRRTDFAGLVDLTLGVGGLLGPVLAGTALNGATARGTVTVRAAAGAATPTDLRVNRAGAGYTLVASAAGAIGDTSAAFNVPLDAAQLAIAKQVGDNQYALAGSLLPVAPAVLVTGPLGDPIAGIIVSFAVTAGGGAVVAARDTTDPTGIATSGRWRLGAPGTQTLDATAAGVAPVTFAASGIVPAQLVFLTQPSTIVAGDTIRPAVVVELQDDQGRQVFGATDSVYLAASTCDVNYTANGDCLTPGGGLIGQPVGTTGRAAVDGRATFDDLTATRAWVTDIFLKASATGGLTGASHGFGVAAGAPAALVIEAGNNQSAVVGTAVATVPSVRLTDNYGNPVYQAGVTVTFATTIGGGSVSGGVQVTDAHGLAGAGAWILGPVPGVNTLSAKANGIADSVVFFATGTAPPFFARDISAGYDFTCAAAAATGYPYCWGANTYSQLGDGTQTARSRPTQLSGQLLELTQVTSGVDFACGLAANGAAYCWGNNWYGQLGIDTADVNQHATPDLVVGGHTFQQISAGFRHVCALDTDGVAWCWGAPSEGSLGNAALTEYPDNPQQVTTTLRFTQLDVGANTSCAVAESGDIWCWGNNGYGQLGNNSTDARAYVPVKVVGGRSFTEVSVGTFHTCGISAGSVYCWGRNIEAQLGIGYASPTSEGGSYVPVSPLGTLGTARHVTAGNTHTCEVNAGGDVYCWGNNTNGQLGDLSTTLRTSAVLVRTAARFTSISAGLLHTCALTEAGAAYCWGTNGSGRLGIGNAASINMTAPVPVVVP